SGIRHKAAPHTSNRILSRLIGLEPATARRRNTTAKMVRTVVRVVTPPTSSIASASVISGRIMRPHTTDSEVRPTTADQLKRRVPTPAGLRPPCPRLFQVHPHVRRPEKCAHGTADSC